jgi:hypothetical protein
MTLLALYVRHDRAAEGKSLPSTKPERNEE